MKPSRSLFARGALIAALITPALVTGCSKRDEPAKGAGSTTVAPATAEPKEENKQLPTPVEGRGADDPASPTASPTASAAASASSAPDRGVQQGVIAPQIGETKKPVAAPVEPARPAPRSSPTSAPSGVIAPQ